MNARCGDGYLQIANGEACDAGGFNVADPAYNECSLECTRGPHCGDGELQTDGGEECESEGVDDETNTCLDTCVYAARILFVTSVATDGDLGGLTGADQLCNTLADAGGLTGTYRAWVLLETQSIVDRFPELFALQSPVNFVNTVGEVLAKSIVDLILGGPAHAIAHDEQGAPAPERLVWTNITSAGETPAGDCEQWTGTTGLARVGHSGFIPDAGPAATAWHDARHWTDLGVDLSCNNSSVHLYCLQVAG